MAAPRPNIMLRKKRTTMSRHHEESGYKQTKYEEKRWEQRRATYAEFEERRIKALYGDHDEKVRIRKELEDAQKEAMSWKIQAALQEQADLDAYVAARDNQDAVVQTLENKQEQARRKYAQELLEENKRLAAYRQQLRLQEEQRDREFEYASLPITRHSLF